MNAQQIEQLYQDGGLSEFERDDLIQRAARRCAYQTWTGSPLPTGKDALFEALEDLAGPTFAEHKAAKIAARAAVRDALVAGGHMAPTESRPDAVWSE